MSVLASAVRPLMATPMWVSTSAIFSMLDGSWKRAEPMCEREEHNMCWPRQVQLHAESDMQ